MAASTAIPAMMRRRVRRKTSVLSPIKFVREAASLLLNKIFIDFLNFKALVRCKIHAV